MTPAHRDRNLVRVRRFTGVIAGAALAACGLFAGLAASATQKAFSTTTTTPTRTTTTQATTTTQPTTTTQTTTTSVTPVTVTPTQSAPIASSGGS